MAHSAKVRAKLVTCTRPEEFITLMNAYEAEAAAREIKQNIFPNLTPYQVV